MIVMCFQIFHSIIKLLPGKSKAHPGVAFMLRAAIHIVTWVTRVSRATQWQFPLQETVRKGGGDDRIPPKYCVTWKPNGRLAVMNVELVEGNCQYLCHTLCTLFDSKRVLGFVFATSI